MVNIIGKLSLLWVKMGKKKIKILKMGRFAEKKSIFMAWFLS